MKKSTVISLFGVQIDNIAREEIIEKIDRFFHSNKYNHIATLNPEILLKARKNESYKNILNATTLNIADGIGLRFAALRYLKNLRHRVTGAELTTHILEKANKENESVYFAVNRNGLIQWEQLREFMEKEYPGIIISGADYDIKNMQEHYPEINADVTLCNFGAPHQEIFLSRLTVGNTRIGIGVGGSLDYIAGTVRRAPGIFQKCGLEWLYRLYKQPRRWKRIYNAVIIFPLHVIFSREKTFND